MQRLTTLALVYTRRWAIPLILLLLAGVVGLSVALWRWTQASEQRSEALRAAHSEAAANQAAQRLSQPLLRLRTVANLLADSSESALEAGLYRTFARDSSIKAFGISWEREQGREIAFHFREKDTLIGRRQFKAPGGENPLFLQFREAPRTMVLAPYKDETYQDGQQEDFTITLGEPLFHPDGSLRAVLELDLSSSKWASGQDAQALISIDPVSQSLFLVREQVQRFPADSAVALLRELGVPAEVGAQLASKLQGEADFEVSLGGDASLHFHPYGLDFLGLDRWLMVTRIRTGYHPGIFVGIGLAFLGVLGLSFLLLASLRRHQRQLEVIDEIAAGILETGDIRDMVSRLYQSLHEKKLLEAPIFVLGIVHPTEPNHLLFPGNFELGPEGAFSQAGQLPPEEFDLNATQFQDRPLVLCFKEKPTILERNFQSGSPETAPTGGRYVPRSYVYVRLEGNQGEKLGVISAQSHRPGAFSREHLEILQRLGRIAALAIQRTASLEARNLALREKNQALQAKRDLEASRDLVFSVLNHEFGNLIYPLNFVSWAFRNEKPLPPDYAREIGLHIQRIMQFNDNIKFWLNSETFGNAGDLGLVSVAEVLEQARDIWAFFALQQKVNVELAGSPPGKVRANHLELNLVVNNLVHNAIKFSASGGRVVLSAEQEDGWVRLHVRDSGIGLSESEMEVLAPDGRVKVHIRPVRGIGPQELKGSGVGLFVSEKLVARMGGHLTLQSEIGKGSRFTVNLKSE